MGVDEIQKIVTDTTREQVNTQEPPTITPQVTNVQSSDEILEATSNKVDTVGKDTMEIQGTTKAQSKIG